MAVFGGTQFQNAKSGDLIEIIYHCRHNTKFRLVNTIIWYYKNGMSAHRYFANRHEEVIWLAKTDKYYFDLDSVRVKYNEKELQLALKDKRLIPGKCEEREKSNKRMGDRKTEWKLFGKSWPPDSKTA